MKSMPATNWDALAASAPLNKGAAIVRDGRGVAFSPPMKSYTASPKDDLKGQRFQRLVVLGVRAREAVDTKASWVCRCDCGRYACVSARGLKVLQQSGRAMCSQCDYVEEVKAGRHPTPDHLRTATANSTARKSRMASVVAITHPKFAELGASLKSVGITEVEFLKAAADFVRVENERSTVCSPARARREDGA